MSWQAPMLTDQQISERLEAQKASEDQSMIDWVDKLAAEDVEIKERDLYQNPQWILASKVLYNANNGKKFAGSDQEAVAYGLDQMGAFNYSFFNMDAPWSEEDNVGMIGYLDRVRNFDDRQKLAFLLLMDTYDEKDGSWEGFMRGVSNIAQDPTTYAGLSALAGVGAKFAGRQAVKGAVKHWLESAAHGAANRAGIATGAIEGSGYASTDEIYRERIDAELSDREAFDDLSSWLKQDLMPAALGGAVIGGLIPGGAAAYKRFRPTADIPVPDSPALVVEEVVKNGKKQRKVKVDESKVDIDAPDFDFPDLQPTLADSHPLIRQDSQTRKKKGYDDPTEFFNPLFGHEGRPIYGLARSQMHNRLIRKSIEKSGASVADSGERKVAVFLGGGAGSGKSTGINFGIDSGLIPNKNYVAINPDDIKEMMPDYKAIRREGDFRAAAQTHEESSDIADMLLEKAVSDGRHVLIDKTMQNPEKAIAMMDLLREKGYQIVFMGVSVDVGTAASRNLGRYYNTARLPHRQAMVRSHRVFNENAEKYLEFADAGIIFDNSAASPMTVATKNREGGDIEIVDPILYNMLIERGNINEQANTIRQLREAGVVP